MLDSKKLFFEVDADHIDVKPLLQKEFLELRMKAISTANPNRNGSWFTKESLEASKDSFINKPILGYFENGDFVSHNGEWVVDSETGLDFWDTYGKKGERILGVIRNNDEIEIVEDRDGVSWICFTCALWVQYNFKQVKRLLKDAKRAKQNGGSTKNISVEVDITDYEMLENGVMKINKFNLVGVTILGSRNGMKVEPGIEGAELSVVDITGRALYEQQASALRLAYEKLDDQAKNEEEKIMENIANSAETVNQFEAEETPVADNNIKEEAEKVEAESCGAGQESCEQELEQSCAAQSDGESAAADAEQCAAEPEQCAEESCGETKETANSATCEDTGCVDCASVADGGTCDVCEEQLSADPQMSAEYLALKAEYDKIQDELQSSLSTITELQATIAQFEHKEFVQSAKEFINSLSLDEQQAQSFVAACEDGSVKSVDELKVQIALKAFDQIVVKSDKVTEPAVFAAPVTNPDTTSAFTGKMNAANKKVDHWTALHDYLGK